MKYLYVSFCYIGICLETEFFFLNLSSTSPVLLGIKLAKPTKNIWRGVRRKQHAISGRSAQCGARGSTRAMEPPAFPRSGVHTTRAAPGSEANILLPLPTGTPPFTYEWSRAGATLDGRFRSSVDANGVRLTVSAAQIGDSGVYTLQASNAAGKDTTRVSLEVSPDEAPTGEDPPTFLRRLQDLTVKVGTRTRFLVEILSSTECKVTWYRNERRLLEAERIALVRDGNFWCADVATVSVDDAGRWTCTAENLGGRASCSAHLNVLVPKAYKRPEFVEELRAILTEQGTVSLECKVVGVPTPVLRWFKDSREIKAGDVFALTANADDPTSLGTYTCEAINCMGRAYSSSKVHVIGRSKEGSARPSSGGLTPDPPPIFTKELEDQFVRICDPLTLSCHIVVPPWPRSTVWYNKEGKIDPSTKYHILEDGVGGYMVEIFGAEWADEGGVEVCGYKCGRQVPKNYRKPRFMENLQAVLTEEGLVSFECKVVGFPTPVLSWFKDGQELKPGDVYQLTGTNSLGSYCCIAKNCMGHASSSAELTVEDIQNQLNEEEKLQLFSKNQAPKFLQGLKSVEVKIDEPFRFTIKVAIPPEPTVLWYRDDQPVDESPRCHLGKEDRGVFYLDIKNLELMDQTEWKCVAMNDFGHSVTSCFLKLIIPRHFKKPRFLENLQAILSDEGAVNLECKVIGVPQPVLKWYKDGEELKPGDIHRIISGQDGTCCLGTYTCEAQNCMGISASSASLLGFEDTVKAKKKKSDDQALQRNLSLSTIHEERTSQMYDTPVADVTLDDKGEISFSFDGKEVSVSLYETPDLTEEEALQIVEMYADQLSENVTEHNVIELPPLRFVKETSTSGNLLMEAIIIDVSPDYFVSPEEDLRTEADIEDISIAEEIGQAQLSFDQEVSVDYIEKTMALISEEKSDIPKVLRRKSDSQKSGENYFSLSKDQSLSEEKKDDDDTQVLSESVSFASAQSTGKQKSKPSQDDEVGTQESDVTKTVLLREEQRTTLDTEIKLISKTNVTNQEEKHNIDPVVIKNVNEDLTYISSVLSKVMNDIQVMERDIILKSQLMSTAAVAAKSLEIITSIIKPLNDIHSITDAVKETINEASELNPVLFTKLPIFLKELQIALAMVEKCIDVGSDKTLIKNTCISVINNCEEDVTKLVTKIKDFALVNKLYLNSELVAEVQSLSSDILNVIEISRSTVATKSILIEDIKNEEVSIDKQHLNRTQKAVYNLKIPLTSLLNIVENALKVNFDTVLDINNAEVILFNMSSSIQDLQTALEHIEFLSVEESNSPLQKYNTNVIETVMGSVLKLRNSFENLSVEKEKREDKEQLNNVLQMISVNLNKISSDIKNIEGPIGAFDILYEDNKLEILQRMAHILISLENSLPILIGLPNIQSTLSAFHKNLTKALENTIESNDMNKYSTLVSICDVVNRINESIKNVQCSQNLSLACIGSNFSIIEEILKNKSIDYVSDQDLLTNARQYCIDIQSIITYTDDESIKIESERVEDITSTSPFFPESKANVVLHQIDHVISVINNISLEETASSISAIIPVLQKSCPILEELKYSVAALTQNAKEYESSLSEISDFSAAESFGKSLQELHENITTLNQVLLESMEDIKIKEDISNVFAKPIHELHTTLQILQENILSQCELYSPVHLSNKVATTELVLQNCILLVKEENEIEPIEELSTLEDISCIKTTAESILADELLLPITDEAFVEQAPPLIEIKSQKPEIAHVFQLLHNDIIDIQKLDILETLNILSEVKEYANLKSATETIVELQNKIIGILSPLLMESLTSVSNLDIVSNDIVTISNSLLRLKNHLCVIDMNNIPIYEDVLQLPSEEIYIIVKKINNLKNHLDECLTAIHDIKEIPELDKQLDALRRQCRELKTIVTEPLNVDLSFESIQCLNKSVDIFLQATESLANNDTVQNVGGQLLKDILIVQDELVDYVSVKENIEENLVVNTINNITVNLAALEQYNIHIYDTLDINIETKFDINAEYDNLIHMKHLIDESEIVVIKELTQKSESADMIIVEDFFKKIKSNFHNLQVLLHQNPSHKKVIRILQEYFALQANINDFKTEMVTLNITQNIQQSLNNFFSQTDNSLEKIKISLLKLTSSLSNTLFKKPLEKLEYSMVQLPECLKLDHLLHLHGLVQNFVLILNIAFPHLENLENVVNKELQMSLFINSESEDNLIIEAIDNFISFLEQETSVSDNAERKLFLIKMLTCSQNHQNYKIALGTGKKMIIMKYLADCSDLLQHHLEDIDKTLATKQKSLQTILNEQIRLLHILHGEVIHLKEQPERSKQEIAAIESCVESIIRLNKSIQDCSNSEKIQSAHQNISLLKDIICQTNTIQDSLDSLKCSTKDISSISSCLDDIKNVVYSISPVEHKLSKQEANVLLQHVEQYIEVTEIIEEISAVLNLGNVQEAKIVAEELRESIAKAEVIPENEEYIEYHLVTEHQENLAQRLQKSLTDIQEQAIENI
ncbi:unnamed protein product [Leptosia nina]|uniref:Ig-like domain-containing protein n=1 Tax=Leptosia nina TaxID=320188 RepID=A0AAV1JWQ3_9NEOP